MNNNLNVDFMLKRIYEMRRLSCIFLCNNQ
jgi:hypothetical protein